MSAYYQLDFEKPVVALEQQIEAAEARLAAESAAGSNGPGAAALRAEIEDLRAKRSEALTKVYSKLTAWETVRVARHPSRPQTRDYIGMMCRDFVELQGDRRYGDDQAIVTGFARIGAMKVMLVGHQKGKQTSEKLACNFGCAHPEGYRKALAKMKLAEKYGVPIVTLVDTPGAYPGLGAEQRGQAEAIAVNMLEMSRLRTPIVSVVIGEGGSGGALGIAVADTVGMLAHSWYSVISPEGCAAILWKEANEQTNTAAAKALKLTASDNLSLGIVDEVIPEPLGGAHRDAKGTAHALQHWIVARLHDLRTVEIDRLLENRYQRYRKMGVYLEQQTPVGQGSN
ncbi:acetyl-CoA carboxylase carboxyl transferase subunit alpha [Phycisphaerales bacterium]|nr:acetyl-CoA carboxylase carboxyl transferase subunit alpha [Phycisphaerales bacterium]